MSVKPRRIYLSLGSNLGDRQGNLDRAIALLDGHFGREARRLSRTVESRALGFDGPDFLNCAVSYESSLEPIEILRVCKEVERSLGRFSDSPRFRPDGSREYCSRTIDIDVLMCGEETVETPELTLPHPKMRERDFVMRPLGEIFEGIL